MILWIFTPQLEIQAVASNLISVSDMQPNSRSDAELGGMDPNPDEFSSRLAPAADVAVGLVILSIAECADDASLSIFMDKLNDL
ncbi:hypothetical protein DNTS_016118 [Danionella cerebrum]|uniref:Uncharacterized protein n=1 Tax=Danionella cerebrum TaxID=2873325 RepID=A0A553Q8N4_9TELE|nr:hypothetical protein DNTS_016118 [Danionella translucida]